MTKGHAQLGLIDNWLRPIKDLYARNVDLLNALDPDARADMLCELNVARSVDNVSHTASVMNAWQEGRELQVHGWCYRIDDGIIRDLVCTVVVWSDVLVCVARGARGSVG